MPTSGFEVRRSNGATRSSASFQGCSVFEVRGRRAGFCCPVHRRPPALLSWLLSKRLDGRLHLDDGRGSKAAVWKLALIVLRRQTTDPWMNAIEGRVFVERGSTVRGRQRALQQLRIWAFPGPASQLADRCRPATAHHRRRRGSRDRPDPRSHRAQRRALRRPAARRATPPTRRRLPPGARRR